jgi:hypothetical protein
MPEGIGHSSHDSPQGRLAGPPTKIDYACKAAHAFVATPEVPKSTSPSSHDLGAVGYGSLVSMEVQLPDAVKGPSGIV